jgi:adenylylsulfate kinase
MAVKGWAIWITGLPASGKSSVTRGLSRELAHRGIHFEVLESDKARKHLTPNPTYSNEERDAFYRSLIGFGDQLAQAGVNVIFDATANKRVWRDEARRRFPRFIEVYLDTPLEVCVSRDPKGIYRAAQQGSASTVPGAQQGYEPPTAPEVTLHDEEPVREKVDKVIEELTKRGFI